jgi:hypothetical protein
MSVTGHRSKTLTAKIGPVCVDVPRDRDSTLTPMIVKKQQRRLNGVDKTVLSLTTKGLTRGEISAHLAEVYGGIRVEGDDQPDHRQDHRRDGRMAKPALGCVSGVLIDASLT